MTSPDPEDRERNREVARNEAERQMVGDIRVSTWAVAVAVMIGVIAFGIVWAWLHR